MLLLITAPSFYSQLQMPGGQEGKFKLNMLSPLVFKQMVWIPKQHQKSRAADCDSLAVIQLFSQILSYLCSMLCLYPWKGERYIDFCINASRWGEKEISGITRLQLP